MLLVVTTCMIQGCLTTAAVSASPSSALLAVNDVHAVGTLGDARLSLAEAIQVVAGDRALDELSSQERVQITGDPGVADLRVVQVVLSPGTVIDSDGPVPMLEELEETVIDGGGAVLTETDAVVPAAGLSVASSRVRIRNLGIRGFATGVELFPYGIANIHSVSLEQLDIEASLFGVNILAADQDDSIGTVRDITVTGSHFRGPSGSSGEAVVGINVTGQTGSVPGGVDDLAITDNYFGGHLYERIHLIGVQGVAAVATGSPGSSQLRNITVARNTFTKCADPCLLAYGGLALGGAVSNGSIAGIRVVDNVMYTSTNDGAMPETPEGVGILMLGGYTLVPGLTDNNSISDILISGNIIRPDGPSTTGTCTGIGLIADWTDFHAGDAAHGRIERAVVEDNEVTGCRRGVMVAGAFSWEEVSGAVRDSTVSDVAIRENRLQSNTTAIHVSGAFLTYTRIWGNSPTDIHAASQVPTGNSVRDVTLDRNMLTGNGTALLVTGASVIDTNGHVVVGNSVERVSQSGNRFSYNQRDCVVIDNHSMNSVGVNTGNWVVNGPC
jgi:hypothetical protein